MKVLLLGATGNMGLRLVAALLTHKHSVIAYVRSSQKLESLLPHSVYSQLTVVEGDAKNSSTIKKAILDHECDAVVNTAGLAAMAPWGSSDLPVIFRTVLDAVCEARKERTRPLRVWFMGGMSVLTYPGSDYLLASCIPVYLEHRGNLSLLKSLPPDTVEWSMLCPSDMSASSTDFSVPTQASSSGTKKLIANANSPPMWQESWMSWIPVIGKSLVAASNFPRYETTLEQNAELIASDLETFESRFSGCRVGIIQPGK